MLREIKRSEKINDNEKKQNEDLLRLFDYRIGSEEFLRISAIINETVEETDKFDPDARI